MVKTLYSEKLQKLEEVEAGGQRFPIWYSSADGILLDFEEMFQYFNVRKNETIVFTIEDSNVLNARVYQFDGLEIDYYRRTLKSSISPTADYFWNFEWMWQIGIIDTFNFCRIISMAYMCLVSY